MFDSWGIDCEIALRRLSLNLTDDKSTLVQVMAWCRQETSHYLNQCWLRYPTPYGVIRPQWVKWELKWSQKQDFTHDDIIKWNNFPRYWPFVWRSHRSPVNSPHKGHWRGALFFSLICAWINGWVNNRYAGDLRRHPAHYDVIVMTPGGDNWSLSFLPCRLHDSDKKKQKQKKRNSMCIAFLLLSPMLQYH